MGAAGTTPAPEFDHWAVPPSAILFSRWTQPATGKKEALPKQGKKQPISSCLSHLSASHQVIRSMIRMIATALLIF
jgi:hypothetical protein